MISKVPPEYTIFALQKSESSLWRLSILDFYNSQFSSMLVQYAVVYLKVSLRS